MPLNRTTYTLLNATTASGISTAYDVSKTDRFIIQVSLTGNSATAVTIVTEGSLDGSTYETINSTTKTNSNVGYFVQQNWPYNNVRVQTTTHATQAAVTATLTVAG